MVFLQLQALDRQRLMLNHLCLMVRSLVDPLQQHLARTSEGQAGDVRSRPLHVPVDTRLPHWPPTVCEQTGLCPCVCSMGARQGTVLAPLLFIIYTADFSIKSPHCHLQNLSDDCHSQPHHR